ncbi:hypothetical protein Pgy4_41794, partial [Pseudomonas savastanoi pv. glycinea str. race 4]
PLLPPLIAASYPQIALANTLADLHGVPVDRIVFA